MDKEKVKITESMIDRIVKESVNQIINQPLTAKQQREKRLADRQQRERLLDFTGNLKNIKNHLFDLACNFEGIEQDIRQELVSIARSIESVRNKIFSGNYGLTQWDNEDYRYDPMFDED